jgi:hypothetical protein
MERIARSEASMLSTESLGEWAGQSSAPKTEQPSVNGGKNLDHTGSDKNKVDSTTWNSTHPPIKVHETTLKVPNQSYKFGRSPSPEPASMRLGPSATAARAVSLSLAQPKAHIPETARMTKARRAPCCEWKHEDFKHSLHMSWLHHYPPHPHRK